MREKIREAQRRIIRRGTLIGGLAGSLAALLFLGALWALIVIRAAS